MEAVRPKVGSSKGKQIAQRKTTKKIRANGERELYLELFLQNGTAALDFLNKRTLRGKPQDFLGRYSMDHYSPRSYSDLAGNCVSCTRSQMHAELHKTTSIMQKNTTSQIFCRQIMFSVKLFEVDLYKRKATLHRKLLSTGTSVKASIPNCLEKTIHANKGKWQQAKNGLTRACQSLD